MINEEDHVSMAVTKPGLDLASALGKVEELEGSVDINFMRDSVLGYLTANPGYVGTGVTASVLLHLPALDVLDEMPRVCDAFVRDWKKLVLYRLLSDRSNECGSFFLLSNRATLSTTPADITSWVSDAAQSLSSKELFARHKIRASRDADIDDKLWRAWGVLRHARTLSFNEVVNMFSLVKLGSDMGILPHIYNREWKRMLLSAQRYHLAMSSQSVILEQSEEGRVRAARFRRFMEKKSSSASFDTPERDKEL
jgi:protein arginine kinase